MNLSTLKAVPFSLVKDDSVYVKVIAVNSYGDSEFSSAGNGAVIRLVPDAPINLQNDLLVTIDSKIKFTWQDGASNGGSAVIDFAVYYD